MTQQYPQMTKAFALTLHGKVYREWQANRATQADLDASELRCRACGASESEIRAAEGRQVFRQEPMP